MWFWQHKRHDQLWLRTATVSLGVHLFFFFFIFFYKGNSSHLSFIISQSSRIRPVEFVFADSISVKKTEVKNNTQSSINSPSIKKTVAPKKEPVSPVKAKAVPKKTEQRKKDAPKQVQPVKQQHEKKTVAPKKELVQEELDFQKKAATMGKHEQELLEEFYILRDKIVHTWRPPRGFPVDCGCQVSMSIGWNGQIQTCSVEKSSGVLIYDSAAQAAVYRVEMPKWTWGKTITIAFNQ